MRGLRRFLLYSSPVLPKKEKKRVIREYDRKLLFTYEIIIYIGNLTLEERGKGIACDAYLSNLCVKGFRV
jgi:hypothetical protein